jgi:hypothetical protein
MQLYLPQTGQRERRKEGEKEKVCEKEEEREGERVRKRERGIEKVRERCRIWLLYFYFLKGMTGAFAPLVI